MRLRIRLAAAVLVAALAPPAPAAAKVAKKQTNVLIILADDFGYGEPGYNGGPASTPNLDALAAGQHSIQFNRFYCGGAVW